MSHTPHPSLHPGVDVDESSTCPALTEKIVQYEVSIKKKKSVFSQLPILPSLKNTGLKPYSVPCKQKVIIYKIPTYYKVKSYGGYLFNCIYLLNKKGKSL